MRLFGVATHETIFVGDADVDHEVALAVGVTFVVAPSWEGELKI